MKREFSTPQGMSSVRINLSRDTIGEGKIGAKSAALRVHQPIFEAIEKQRDGEQVGIFTLPHVSITPALLRNILRRVGADYAKPEEAIAAIDRTELTAEELDAIRDATAPFAGLYTAIRSDEATSAGVGLWHTGFVLTDNKPATLMQVAEIVKQILKSDFSRDVLAFKRRMGIPLEENPGVMIMPVSGTSLTGATAHMFGSLLHANLITSFMSYGDLVNIGVGVGGANNLGAKTEILQVVRPVHLTAVQLSTNSLHSRFLTKEGLQETADVESGPDVLDMILNGLNPLLTKILADLRDAIDKIKATKKGLYLELALERYAWGLVQCSEVSLQEITAPEVPEDQKVLEILDRGDNEFAQYGARVCGRRIIEADQIFYLADLSEVSIQRLREINDSTNNYVLITDAEPRNISNDLSFADYSNAAAMISSSTDAKHSIGTHFNGAFREAGIVFLVGKVNSNFLRELKRGEVTSRKVIVYANDADEEGFVATI